MPMMLDNSMPMEMDEDLFGEGADVMGSLMPMRPQSKHLRQRLDEMRTRGCCQYELSYPSPLPAHFIMSFATC
jgi:mediator of RNA polymerase II transcription subunit 16